MYAYMHVCNVYTCMHDAYTLHTRVALIHQVVPIVCLTLQKVSIWRENKAYKFHQYILILRGCSIMPKFTTLSAKNISSPEDLILNRSIVLSAKQWFTA